jgi:hypothetical protein
MSTPLSWTAAVVGLFLIGVALLARWELLVYAARNRGDPARTARPTELSAAVGTAAQAPPRAYVVYLDGIGKLRARDTRDGRLVVQRLVDADAELRVLGHVLPYSPLGRELVARRGATWLRHRAAVTLFLYNALQVFMAADHRYRPYYNTAVAAAIDDQLRAAGYAEGSGIPIVLLGYSGGAQVGLGAAPAVARDLRAPVTAVLLGGFHNGANDLRGLVAVHELGSHRDAIARIGRWLFPPRWPVARRSPWQRARRDGLVREHDLSPATHLGPESYISPESVLPDGRTYLDRTRDLVVNIVVDGAS